MIMTYCFFKPCSSNNNAKLELGLCKDAAKPDIKK